MNLFGFSGFSIFKCVYADFLCRKILCCNEHKYVPATQDIMWPDIFSIRLYQYIVMFEVCVSKPPDLPIIQLVDKSFQPKSTCTLIFLISP